MRHLEVFKKTIAGAKVKYLDTESKQQQVALASDISTTDVSYGEDSSGNKVLRFTTKFCLCRRTICTDFVKACQLSLQPMAM